MFLLLLWMLVVLFLVDEKGFENDAIIKFILVGLRRKEEEEEYWRS